MTDVVNAIQNAIEIIGRMRQISKNIENAEFKNLLADLSNEIADAKLEVVGLKEEVVKLREALLKKEALLAQREEAKPTLQGDCYVFAGETGLFCTACFDDRKKKIRVTAVDGPFNVFGQYRCNVCDSWYGKADRL